MGTMPDFTGGASPAPRNTLVSGTAPSPAPAPAPAPAPNYLTKGAASSNDHIYQQRLNAGEWERQHNNPNPSFFGPPKFTWTGGESPLGWTEPGAAAAAKAKEWNLANNNVLPGQPGLGPIPTMTDLLSFMSYSSPTGQAIKRQMEAGGVFDRLAPFLTPHVAPTEWARKALGDYAPPVPPPLPPKPPELPLKPGEQPVYDPNVPQYGSMMPRSLLELLRQIGLVTQGSLTPPAPPARPVNPYGGL